MASNVRGSRARAGRGPCRPPVGHSRGATVPIGKVLLRRKRRRPSGYLLRRSESNQRRINMKRNMKGSLGWASVCCLIAGLAVATPTIGAWYSVVLSTGTVNPSFCPTRREGLISLDCQSVRLYCDAQRLFASSEAGMYKRHSRAFGVAELERLIAPRHHFEFVHEKRTRVCVSVHRC